jgi:hypothetical protein
MTRSVQQKRNVSSVEAFISYSHRDEKFRVSLETHLALLKRNGVLGIWHDRKISPGDNFEDAIDSHLRSADLILLLVSPDFIASDYCYSTELRLAMDLHSSGRARVVPMILRPVDWQDAPFSGLLALPTDGKAISTWRNRDEAYLDVTNGIRKLLDEPSNDSRTARMLGGTPVGFAVHRYQGSVLQVGGIGSRLVTKRVWLTTEHGYLPADEYLIHSFNGAGDVMWVHCPEEFQIVGATSPTGNNVFPMQEGDSRFPYGLRLIDQLQNRIVVTCERKPDERVRGRATGTVCPKCGDPMGPFQKFCAKCGFSFTESKPDLREEPG